MKKNENEIKQMIDEANKTCFITCTELAEKKITIYVTEKAVMLRDNRVMSNSVLIPFDEFLAHRDEILAQQLSENAETGSNSPGTSPTMADTSSKAQS